MENKEQIQQNLPSKKDEKKTYQKPQLTKHGAVESLTQHNKGGCSGPVTLTKKG